MPAVNHRSARLVAALLAAIAAPCLAADSQWPLSVIIVDESGSMKNRDAPQWLEENLIDSAGSTAIMYGLVAFSESARVVDSGAGTLWPADGLAAGFAELDLTRGVEDGLAAVRFALDEFGVFPDAAPHYLLVSDEDRDIVDAGVDVAELGEALTSAGAVLDAMLSVSLRCGRERALGLARDGVAWVADGRGGFRTCEGGYVQNLVNSPVRDYVTLALGSGGTVWDIGMAGWRVDGKHYPALDSPRRSSASAAWAAAAKAQWKRRLDAPLIARAYASRLMTTVGGVVELDATRSYSRDASRDIAQIDWLVDGELVSAGESAALVAERPGPMRITLRVTDSGFPPRVSEDVVTVWVFE
ncbi:MAG: hypothetical protein AAGD86_05865 [Pseudomonadota bacterium]